MSTQHARQRAIHKQQPTMNREENGMDPTDPKNMHLPAVKLPRLTHFLDCSLFVFYKLV